MPGILYHLSFAEQVYRRIANNLPLNKVDFMAGNLIPDLAADKNSAHYRIKASHEEFWVPDMELVARDLFVPTDSVKFGMFCLTLVCLYLTKGVKEPGEMSSTNI